MYPQPNPFFCDSSSHINADISTHRQVYYHNGSSSYSNTQHYSDSQGGNFESLALRGVASPQVYSTYSELQHTGQINFISVNETYISTDLAGIIAQKPVLKAVHSTESVEYQTAVVHELPICVSEVANLINHVQSSRFQHTSHFDHCLANRRFSPDIKKPDVSYITPQIILTEFQVLNDVCATAKAVNNSEFSVVTEQIEFSMANIQLTRSVVVEYLSDCKSSRFPKAGFRTGIDTGGPHSVITFATRLMCDARERNMPWDPGINAC